MLKRRMPLSTVQQLAGHKSIQVTAMIYANLLVDELHDAYDDIYAPPDLTN
jgi:integrase